MTLRTRYEFTLPRGYVDEQGAVHRTGVMRLATARDELEPLRDPTIDGPDDPRLTIVVLARVVERLGSLELVTTHEIEGLFAADLAYLQDFYGVINFGTQDEFDAFVAAQSGGAPVSQQPAVPTAAVPTVAGPTAPGAAPAAPAVTAAPAGGPAETSAPAPVPTTAIGDAPAPTARRSAIEEIPAEPR